MTLAVNLLTDYPYPSHFSMQPSHQERAALRKVSLLRWLFAAALFILFSSVFYLVVS